MEYDGKTGMDSVWFPVAFPVRIVIPPVSIICTIPRHCVLWECNMHSAYVDALSYYCVWNIILCLQAYLYAIFVKKPTVTFL